MLVGRHVEGLGLGRQREGRRLGGRGRQEGEEGVCVEEEVREEEGYLVLVGLGGWPVMALY